MRAPVPFMKEVAVGKTFCRSFSKILKRSYIAGEVSVFDGGIGIAVRRFAGSLWRRFKITERTRFS